MNFNLYFNKNIEKVIFLLQYSRIQIIDFTIILYIRACRFSERRFMYEKAFNKCQFFNINITFLVYKMDIFVQNACYLSIFFTTCLFTKKNCKLTRSMNIQISFYAYLPPSWAVAVSFIFEVGNICHHPFVHLTQSKSLVRRVFDCLSNQIGIG